MRRPREKLLKLAHCCPGQRPLLGKACVGRGPVGLPAIFFVGVVAAFFSGIPRSAATSLALLMLIEPVPGGPPQPQHTSSPATEIAVAATRNLCMFIFRLNCSPYRYPDAARGTGLLVWKMCLAAVQDMFSEWSYLR